MVLIKQLYKLHFNKEFQVDLIDFIKIKRFIKGLTIKLDS